MPDGFQRVAIVGCGLIGGSIELALRARRVPPDLVALDRGDDLGAVAGADLVILATPIAETIRLLPEVARHAPSALLTDTGSTKAAVVAAADGLRFIGGHPVAGAAAAGRAAADADLFRGRPWILTPGAAPDAADVARLGGWIEALGATVHRLEAAAHDRLFALVSHLPQMTASALMHVVGTACGAEGLALAGAGLRDTTRLAGSPAGIWNDIQTTNRDNVMDAIDLLIAALTRLRDDPEGTALTSVFDSAAMWRTVLTSGSTPPVPPADR